MRTASAFQLGTLDATFDGDGVSLVTLDAWGQDYAFSLAATPEGKFMLGGYKNPGGSDFAIVRSNGSVGNERLFAINDVQTRVTSMVDRGRIPDPDVFFYSAAKSKPGQTLAGALRSN